MGYIEKRKYPRIKQSLPIKISNHNLIVTVETNDISANGVYCLIDREIPIMTKLQIMLFVPFKQNNKDRKSVV